jgi:aminoglycoside phosphotransferase
MHRVDINKHLRKCLGIRSVAVVASQPFKSGSGADVLDCEFATDDESVNHGVLKVYNKGFDDYSGIGVLETARKFVLAYSELSSAGINIPKVLGSNLSSETPSVLTEKLAGLEWDKNTRTIAADILGRLHSVPLDTLSVDFRRVITESLPNRDRVRNGVVSFSESLSNNHPEWQSDYPRLFQETTDAIENEEPSSSMSTLVHGDYFSVNIIRTMKGVFIADWDLLAVGDPMWDLGFLLGADKDVQGDEARAAMEAYKSHCRIDEHVLSWHRKCWSSFWELMHLKNTL